MLPRKSINVSAMYRFHKIQILKGVGELHPTWNSILHVRELSLGDMIQGK